MGDIMRVLKILALVFLIPFALLVTLTLILDLTGNLDSKTPMSLGGYITAFGIDALIIYASYRIFRSLRPKRQPSVRVSAEILETPATSPSGEKKGFFQRFKEKRARKAEVQQATSSIRNAVVSGIFQDDLFDVAGAVSQVAMPARLDAPTVRATVISSLGRVVDSALEDGILTEDEEQRISDLMDHYSIAVEDISQALAERLVQAAVIRDLMEGTVKPRLSVTDMPFNLGKKEIVIWLFRNVHAYEHKTGYRYVGGSSGTSIRIAKGVYWRVGSYRGRRVPEDQRIGIGSGPLAVTNKYLYFMGGGKSLRVAHNKIISIVPTGGSVLVGRDLARSHTLEFSTNDDWALANILSNAQNWE